jgi:glucokinase
LFDFQAQALGLHVANLTLALDASIVIIGGGLMDPEATSTEFRERRTYDIWADYWPKTASGSLRKV